MTRKNISLTIITVAAVGLIPQASFAWGGLSEFDSVEIFIEQNATDDNAEIGIEAEPDSDNGLVRLDVFGPDFRRVVSVRGSRSKGGMQNIADLESPALDGLAITDRYPEGMYYFFGIATDGERFFGSAELSHELTEPTTILSPMEGDVVSPSGFTIMWTAVDGAEIYILEIENDSDELGNILELPGDVTHFDVPASLLAPEAEFETSVIAVGENGNLVQVEVLYSTGE